MSGEGLDFLFGLCYLDYVVNGIAQCLLRLRWAFLFAWFDFD